MKLSLSLFGYNPKAFSAAAMLPKRLVRVELRSQATRQLSSGGFKRRVLFSATVGEVLRRVRLAVFWVSVELYMQRLVVDGRITGSDRPSLDSVDQHYLELVLK